MDIRANLQQIVRGWVAIATIAGLVIAIGLMASWQPGGLERMQSLPFASCRPDQSRLADDQGNLKIVRCVAYVDLAARDTSPQAARSDSGSDLALLAPIIRDAITVSVNGSSIGEARINFWRMPARLATVPAIIIIPNANLHPKNNRLDIVVTAFAGREPRLDKLYIGPKDTVLEQFRRLWFMAEVLPTLIMGGQAALAVMFFTIWNRRRQETAFGWFALVLILDTLRGSPMIPSLAAESSGISYWSLLVPYSSAAYLMFSRALVDLPASPRTWVAVFAAPLLITVVAVFAAPVVIAGILMPIGIAVVCANLFGAAAVFASGWRRGVPEARLLFICTVLFAGLVVHDVLLSLQLIEGQVAVARPGLLVLLVAMIAVMITRFTGAMSELDQTAETLRRKADEIEAELKRAYDRLREQRETAILAQERARLMRDLHDGLGGEMVAVLALAEQNAGKGEEIAYHARAALADMRLIIASLEDYGGDLTLALGAWKERAEPQIQAAGMLLHWELGELGDDLHFGPTQILDILRILQEALTNVIHHARAKNIKVCARLEDDMLMLTITDDGDGIGSDARSGKGLANMRSRAMALGGQLDIAATVQGTSIGLLLPLRAVK